MRASLDPPTPSGSSLRQTLRFFNDPFQLFLDGMKECGDVFSLQLLGIGEWVVLCSRETLRQAYEAAPGTLSGGELLGQMAGFMFGLDATAFLEGSAHKQRQQRIVPLLNGSTTLRHVETMRLTTERVIAEWPVGKPFALMPSLNRIALEVVMRVLLGLEAERRIDHLVRAYDRFTDKCLRSPLIAMPFLQIDLGAISPWGNILRLRDKTRSAFESIVEERKRKLERLEGEKVASKGGDVLDELMLGSKRGGETLPEVALVDELMALLFAGHETTSTSLGWILALSLEHPEVVERIRREVADVLGDRPIEAGDLAGLKYLEAVINEGLRLGRRAPFTGLRLVKRPFVVNGFEIAPGKIVALSHYGVCHRDDTYPRAACFEPERFLQKRVVMGDWSPFGRGERACAGRGLAMVELKVILATVFQRVRLELHVPVTKATRQGFLFAPGHGLSVRLTAR